MHLEWFHVYNSALDGSDCRESIRTWAKKSDDSPNCREIIRPS